VQRRWGADTVKPMADGDKPSDPFFEDAQARDTRASFVQEWVKKAAVAGMGALFMTEEGIRNLASQMKLPKEVLTFVLSSAEKTKDEIGRVVTEEVRRFLQSEKLRDEFLKLLTRMTLEVTAQVRLVPESEKPGEEGAPLKPKLTVTDLHVRRGGRGKKE
jgi:hypothetical protein